MTETTVQAHAARLAGEISDLADRIGREVGEGLATSMLYDLSVAIGEGRPVADLWPDGLKARLADTNADGPVSPGGPRDQARTGPHSATQPPGEYATITLPGYTAWEGWVTEETLAGAGMLVVRDGTGRVLARVHANAWREIIPAEPPRPEYTARLAIGSGHEPDGSGGYEEEDDYERHPF